MYRGESTAGPSCAKHAAAPAASACGRCQAPICELCIVYFGAQPHCHPCALKRRRNRALGRVALGLGALALVGGVVAAAIALQPRFDYGENRLEVERLEHAALADRCDRQKTLDYDEKLLDVGDNEGALLDVGAFFRACGDWYRLHWTAYTAHTRRREWQAAADEAGKLIAHNPADKDYWWWRAQAWEAAGDLVRAAADYRQTLVNLPRIGNIPFNLATVYEKLGQPCRAVGAIEQFLFHRPGQRDDANVAARLARLVAAGHCERLAGHGTAIVQNWPQDVYATVGGVRGRMAFDRRVTYTLVTRAFAERAHVPTSGEPIRVQFERHWMPGTLVTVPALAVDSARAGEIEAVVVEELPDRLDVVIGLSFMTRFETNLDGESDPSGLEDELHLIAP